MPKLLRQSLLDMGRSIPLLYSVFPTHLTPDEVQRYDKSLTDMMQEVDLPDGWSMVKPSGKSECTYISV